MAFQRLSVSADGHRLIQADGTPFFYLADTAWELFHRLDREDALCYLRDRVRKGFTAIQAVTLSEFDGLRVPNAYGRVPLDRDDSGSFDPAYPDDSGDYSYWAHVDFIVGQAAELGLYIAMLPTWGDKFNLLWGKGPEIFSADNARAYGRWLGRRYADAPNIIWVLGGDRPLDNVRHFDVVRALAHGLRENDGGGHIMTFHPTGANSSAKPLHDEEWLDFNMIQSGHTRRRFNYKMISCDYARQPAKPVLDGEPGYEDHPEDFDAANGYLDAADVRQFAYMSLLTGACGHTYGDHSIWSMVDELPVEGFAPTHFCCTWRQAIDSPGAGQMHFAKDLLMAHGFLTLAPHPEYVSEQLPGVLHIPVLANESSLLAYTAQGRPIALEAGVLGGRVRVRWFDPRTGVYRGAGTADCTQPLRFTPPTGGRGNDWVLVLENVEE